MHRQKHPAPLAGGNRAGIGHAEQAVGTHESQKDQAARHFRRQHLAERVHALGARALLELVEELDRHHGIGSDLDRRLERFAGVDPEVFRALGGDLFPASPIRAVGNTP